MFKKDLQYYKFCTYGFLKNLRFFEPFFILYLTESGISFFRIGILITVKAITSNIIEIPSGVLADIIGRKKAMILSFISYILSFLIFFLLRNYYAFIAAMILYAFGDSFRTGTHKAMIMDYLKAKGWLELRAQYYGKTRSWSQRGSAVSALIAAALVFYSGSYHFIFSFTIIPYFMDLLLMISYPSWLDGKSEKTQPESKQIFSNIIKCLKNPELRKRLINASGPKGLFESVKDYIQPVIATFSLALPIMKTYSNDKRTALMTGIVYSLIYVLTSIASSNGSKLSNNFKSTKNYLNTALLTGILTLLFSSLFLRFDLTSVSIILFMLFYFIHNLRTPVAISFLSEEIDNSIMASVLSIEAQLKSIIVAIMAPLIGLTADKFGLAIALASVCILWLLIFTATKLSEPSR
ncbi:MAG: MFS transporter [Spirochaetales bacterium]|nr:MFS transporter [Spirochaetales bacterium]